MAEVNNYAFSFEEVATSLVKQLDLHEGLWSLTVNYSFTPKNITKDGNTKASKPGFVGVLEQIGLVRAMKPVPGQTVDAAKVNPVVKSRDTKTRLN